MKTKTDTTASQRRERERERHRNEILDAGEAIFGAKGYQLTTMEEIAKASEFSVGSIYNFFPGKKQLYQEVLNRLASQLKQQFQRARPDSSAGAVEQLKQTLVFRLRFLEEHSSFMRFFIQEASSNCLDWSSILPETAKRIIDELNLELTRILEYGMKNGIFRNYDPGLLCLCIDGIMKAFIADWMNRHSEGSILESAGQLFSLILDFVTAGQQRS